MIKTIRELQGFADRSGWFQVYQVSERSLFLLPDGATVVVEFDEDTGKITDIFDCDGARLETPEEPVVKAY